MWGIVVQFSASMNGVNTVITTCSKIPSFTRKYARKALRAGIEVTRKAAQANAEAISARSGISTGVFAKSVAAYAMRNKGPYLRAGVMIRKNAVNKYKIIKGKAVRVGLYASVLEYGKANQAPQSWLRSAASSTASQAAGVVASSLEGHMSKVVREAGGK